jgi:hypothetical protein
MITVRGGLIFFLFKDASGLSVMRLAIYSFVPQVIRSKESRWNMACFVVLGSQHAEGLCFSTPFLQRHKC